MCWRSSRRPVRLFGRECAPFSSWHTGSADARTRGGPSGGRPRSLRPRACDSRRRDGRSGGTPEHPRRGLRPWQRASGYGHNTSFAPRDPARGLGPVARRPLQPRRVCRRDASKRPRGRPQPQLALALAFVGPTRRSVLVGAPRPLRARVARDQPLRPRPPTSREHLVSPARRARRRLGRRSPCRAPLRANGRTPVSQVRDLSGKHHQLAGRGVPARHRLRRRTAVRQALSGRARASCASGARARSPATAARPSTHMAGTVSTAIAGLPSLMGNLPARRQSGDRAVPTARSTRRVPQRVPSMATPIRPP